MYVRRCTTQRRENTSSVREIPGPYKTPNDAKNKIAVSTRISTETKIFGLVIRPLFWTKKTIFP